MVLVCPADPATEPEPRPVKAGGSDTVSQPSTTSESVMMLCPNLKCRKLLRVPIACRGKQVKCQFCELTFRVPEPKQNEQQSQ